MEENIYDFLGLTPKDGEAKVKEELEAQIKKWTNQLTRQAARAKAKLEVLKRFKAELGTNPNMLKEHADKYTSLIAQKKQQQVLFCLHYLLLFFLQFTQYSEVLFGVINTFLPLVLPNYLNKLLELFYV